MSAAESRSLIVRLRTFKVLAGTAHRLARLLRGVPGTLSKSSHRGTTYVLNLGRGEHLRVESRKGEVAWTLELAHSSELGENQASSDVMATAMSILRRLTTKLVTYGTPDRFSASGRQWLTFPIRVDTISTDLTVTFCFARGELSEIRGFLVSPATESSVRVGSSAEAVNYLRRATFCRIYGFTHVRTIDVQVRQSSRILTAATSSAGLSYLLPAWQLLGTEESSGSASTFDAVVLAVPFVNARGCVRG